MWTRKMPVATTADSEMPMMERRQKRSSSPASVIRTSESLPVGDAHVDEEDAGGHDRRLGDAHDGEEAEEEQQPWGVSNAGFLFLRARTRVHACVLPMMERRQKRSSKPCQCDSHIRVTAGGGHQRWRGGRRGAAGPVSVARPCLTCRRGETPTPC